MVFLAVSLFAPLPLRSVLLLRMVLMQHGKKSGYVRVHAQGSTHAMMIIAVIDCTSCIKLC